MQKLYLQLVSRLAGIVFASAFLLTSTAFSQQIITTGITKTDPSSNGSMTTVLTSSIFSANAYNSFFKFDVDAEKSVAFIVPATAQNLICIINSSSPTVINGKLFTLRYGQIEGKIFIVNPKGIVIGPNGSVNSESIVWVTPTQEFVDNFFIDFGRPDPASLAKLLSGTVPVNTAASIINNGVINFFNPNDTSFQPPRFK